MCVQRGEIAADKAKSDDIRDVLLNAANMYRELHYMKEPLIALRPAPIAKPVEPYVPKCDAHFKVRSTKIHILNLFVTQTQNKHFAHSLLCYIGVHVLSVFPFLHLSREENSSFDLCSQAHNS